MTSNRAVQSGRIVVGVDGSSCSGQALRWAARVADLTGAAVEAVLVWDYPAVYLALGWTAPQWDPRKEAHTMLVEAVDAAYDGDRPERLTLSARQGSPADVLLASSADAGMLVVGSRGRGGFAGLLLGSVSAQCVEHAACPVLVIHEQLSSPTTLGSAGPSDVQNP